MTSFLGLYFARFNGLRGCVKYTAQYKLENSFFQRCFKYAAYSVEKLKNVAGIAHFVHHCQILVINVVIVLFTLNLRCYWWAYDVCVCLGLSSSINGCWDWGEICTSEKATFTSTTPHSWLSRFEVLLATFFFSWFYLTSKKSVLLSTKALVLEYHATLLRCTYLPRASVFLTTL